MNWADRRFRVAARVGLVAMVAGTVVILAGGGSAFWLCLPAVLLACACPRTRGGMVLAAVVVVAFAAVPALAAEGLRPLPSATLVVVVPAGIVAVFLVVRQRLEREIHRLHRFAYTDPLTGAANRRCMVERINYEAARHTRTSGSFTVLMLDLDGFKRLNDRFGHGAGDELLCDVTGAIKEVIRAQDTIARFGGDEFAVLAPETDAPGGRRLAARIAQAIGAVTAGVDGLSASSGIALFPEDGRSALSLLDAADQRLLQVKRSRRVVVEQEAA